MPCELGKFIKKLKDLKHDKPKDLQKDKLQKEKLQDDYGFDSRNDFEQFKHIIGQSLTELSTQVCAKTYF